MIDGWLNEGQLFFTKSRIFFITSLFVDIFDYGPEGTRCLSKMMGKINFSRETDLFMLKRDDQ